MLSAFELALLEYFGKTTFEIDDEDSEYMTIFMKKRNLIQFSVSVFSLAAVASLSSLLKWMRSGGMRLCVMMVVWKLDIKKYTLLIKVTVLTPVINYFNNRLF